MSDLHHIVCPHCHTTNRVAGADLARAPDCGKCHKVLFVAHSVALDEAGFERHIGRSRNLSMTLDPLVRPLSPDGAGLRAGGR